MAKISVRSFVRKAQQDQELRYRNQSAAEVLLGSVKRTITNLDPELAAAGYFSRKISNPDPDNKQKAGQWCIEHFGFDHFIVTVTNTFWFDSERNANWFSLRW